MRLNPHIQYYSTVYVISMGAALLLKTMRGLVFVKVSLPASAPPLPPSDNEVAAAAAVANVNIYEWCAVKRCSCLIVFTVM